jgi:hypothetical protein
VVQKALIRDQGRASEKKAKDCYYMYEVAVLFRNALDDLHRASRSLRKRVVKPWVTKYERDLRRLFATPHWEGCIAAVRVHAGARQSTPGSRRSIREDEVCAVMTPLVSALLD